MSMMGSAPVGGGGLSFEDVIGLLKDEQAYQAKLRELQKRTEEAKANLQQAVEVSRKTEEAKTLTRKMMDQTTEQVIEARNLKDEADQKVATAAAHEKELALQHETFQRQAEAELEGHRQHLRDAFTAREKEVAAKEQDLLARIKDFEAVQADRDVRAHEFDAYRKAREEDFARKDEELRTALASVQAEGARARSLQQGLQEKLNKIKSISAG